MTEVSNRIFKMNPDFWQARSPAPDPKVTEKIVNELQVRHFFANFIAIFDSPGFITKGYY